MEASLLDTASAEDSAPARSLGELKSIFCSETVKVWKIASPAVITILCQFGINGVNSIFIGHLGDIELSAVSISLNFVGTFSFGFMVRLLFMVSWFIFECFLCFFVFLCLNIETAKIVC